MCYPVARCPSRANPLLDDDWHHPQPKCPPQWFWGACPQSSQSGAIAPTPISTVVIESQNPCCSSASGTVAASPINLEAGTAVFEPGYNAGMELLLYHLGRRGLSGQNHSYRLADRCPIQQYGAAVAPAARLATSHAGAARWRRGGIAGRPRLC